jgi:ribosomal protein L32
LHIKQQEENQKTKDSQKSRISNKCPNCGEQLRSFEIICSACGYELKGILENRYIKDLTEKLDNIMKESLNKHNDNIYEQEEELSKLQAGVIRNFNLPISREDLLNAFYFIGPKAKFQAGMPGLVTKAWRSKFKEIYLKLKLLISNKNDFQTYEVFYHNMTQSTFFERFWYGSSLRAKAGIVLAIVLIVIIIIIIVAEIFS